MNGNPTVEPNFVADAGLFTPESSGLAVPLFSANGVAFGAVALYSREQAAFSKDHRHTLEDLMPEFARALERAMRPEAAPARERACPEAEESPVLESVQAS
jgi:GAF domain-containing protein